jgi:hypothetical protein
MCIQNTNAKPIREPGSADSPNFDGFVVHLTERLKITPESVERNHGTMPRIGGSFSEWPSRLTPSPQSGPESAAGEDTTNHI